jgi:hypothetical protein
MTYMGKKKSKSKKKEDKRIGKVEEQVKIAYPKRTNWFKRLSLGWRIFLAIISILTFCQLSYFVYDTFIRSDVDKTVKQRTDEGDLKFPKISNEQNLEPDRRIETEGLTNFNYDTINYKFPKINGIYLKDLSKQKLMYVELGGYFYRVPLDSLYHPMDFFEAQHQICSNTKMIVGIKNDRVYVSTEFKRLQNEETMGIMQFNHWSLYKDNYLRCPVNNDTMLEVRDKENNIAFAIQYVVDTRNIPGVRISGYFVGVDAISIVNSTVSALDDSVSVWGTNCIRKQTPNWKQKSLHFISKIKSLSGSPI